MNLKTVEGGGGDNTTANASATIPFFTLSPPSPVTLSLSKIIWTKIKFSIREFPVLNFLLITFTFILSTTEGAAESGKFDAFELFPEAEGGFPNAERWRRAASVAAKKIGTKEKYPIELSLIFLLEVQLHSLFILHNNNSTSTTIPPSSELTRPNSPTQLSTSSATTAGDKMTLTSPQLQRFVLTKYHGGLYKTAAAKSSFNIRARSRSCSAIAIDTPGSSLTDVAGIRWGSTSLQGAREEMEDAVVVRSEGLDEFSFAAVFDGHAGFNSVKFLRDELYKECCAALQGGLLLRGNDFKAIREALLETFEKVDSKLLNWLESNGEKDESGSTATLMFVGNDTLVISHVGDSCVVQSCSGKAEVLTHPHRPYGSNKASLQEIKRIREEGGWISNGRICGDIAVSRAFGDMRFKTKKNEVQFNGDLVTASPDVFQVTFGTDSEFVLLASDGLWDYINRSVGLNTLSKRMPCFLMKLIAHVKFGHSFSSDAVTFVRNQLRKHGDVQLACDALAEAALDQRSQDNISIVIADLGRTDWQGLPFQQQNVVYEFGQAFATVGIVSLGIWISTSLLST
ncbi:hypothetical protein DVH24_024941 [Malus domestica]|uniref:protein-serine/threonine phosphatase n=1 Tax=Malus domestica TaxID=3750 RepID=A0A498JK21_MALDO|nr:hypothetical protein DVH24_024941 [Malus domestica]